MKIRVGMGFDVHQLVEGRDLWMGGINIYQAIAFLGYQFYRFLEYNLTVHTIGLCTGIGKVITYITHIGGAEKGIADSVQQYVGITVTQQAFGMLQLDATHPQVAAFH